MTFDEWYRTVFAEKKNNVADVHSDQIFYMLCRMAWYAALDSEEVTLLRRDAYRYLKLREAALNSGDIKDIPDVERNAFDSVVDNIVLG